MSNCQTTSDRYDSEYIISNFGNLEKTVDQALATKLYVSIWPNEILQRQTELQPNVLYFNV